MIFFLTLSLAIAKTKTMINCYQDHRILALLRMDICDGFVYTPEVLFVQPFVCTILLNMLRHKAEVLDYSRSVRKFAFLSPSILASCQNTVN